MVIFKSLFFLHNLKRLYYIYSHYKLVVLSPRCSLSYPRQLSLSPRYPARPSSCPVTTSSHLPTSPPPAPVTTSSLYVSGCLLFVMLAGLLCFQVPRRSGIWYLSFYIWLTWHNALQVHPCCWKWQRFLLFYGWAVCAFECTWHLLYPFICFCACSVVSTSWRPRGLESVVLLRPWGSPGKNTGVGCHFLLKGIFPT